MKTLKDIKPQSFELKLKHPKDGSDLGASLLIVGQDSKYYVDAVNRYWINRFDNKVEEVTPQMQIDEVTELMASCVIGWAPDEFFGGPFTLEAIREIFKDGDYSFIRKQMKEVFDDRSNFFLE